MTIKSTIFYFSLVACAGFSGIAYSMLNQETQLRPCSPDHVIPSRSDTPKLRPCSPDHAIPSRSDTPTLQRNHLRDFVALTLMEPTKTVRLNFGDWLNDELQKVNDKPGRQKTFAMLLVQSIEEIRAQKTIVGFQATGSFPRDCPVISALLASSFKLQAPVAIYVDCLSACDSPDVLAGQKS